MTLLVVSYSLVSIVTSFHDDKPTMQWCYKTLDFWFSKGDRVRFAVCREYFALTTHHTHGQKFEKVENEENSNFVISLSKKF